MYKGAHGRYRSLKSRVVVKARPSMILALLSECCIISVKLDQSKLQARKEPRSLQISRSEVTTLRCGDDAAAGRLTAALGARFNFLNTFAAQKGAAAQLSTLDQQAPTNSSI